jgi:hypothetical protein
MHGLYKKIPLFGQGHLARLLDQLNLLIILIEGIEGIAHILKGIKQTLLHKLTNLLHKKKSYHGILARHNTPGLKPGPRHGQPNQRLQLSISNLKGIRGVVLPEGQVETLDDLAGLGGECGVDLAADVAQVAFYLAGGVGGVRVRAGFVVALPQG